MSPHRIAAILLRAWRGKSVAEIAAELQTGPKPVEDVLRRMAERLKGMFAPPTKARAKSEATIRRALKALPPRPPAELPRRNGPMSPPMTEARVREVGWPK